MAVNTNQKRSVLSDASNAQGLVFQELLAKKSRYGIAAIKRAYGDWAPANLKGWKDLLQRMVTQPVKQFSCTSGNNAADTAAIRDTMIVWSLCGVGHYQMSSDSCFNRMASCAQFFKYMVLTKLASSNPKIYTPASIKTSGFSNGKMKFPLVENFF